MRYEPPPLETVFASIYWTYDDLLIALARRLPEFEELDALGLLDEKLTPKRVGVTRNRLEELATRIGGVLEDISVSRGWEVLDDSLDWHLGFAHLRIEKGEHPNAPVTKER